MNRSDLQCTFSDLGLLRGDVIFIHSSLSSLGNVEGGADTVVEALLGALGPEGTLVAPTFTFNTKKRVFDPAADPSGMGHISETVRTHPRAVRSVHRYHSVAAVGRLAKEITATHGPSAWAGDSPFWQLYTLDARIFLLGVTYQTCTFFHVIEQLVHVPYREWKIEEWQLRSHDGSVHTLPTHFFMQTADSPGNDFNKFGCALEDRGLVTVQRVGNAVTRHFKARNAVAVGIELYRQDSMIFAQTGGRTPLRDGIEIEADERCVVDPNSMFSRKAR